MPENWNGVLILGAVTLITLLADLARRRVGPASDPRDDVVEVGPEGQHTHSHKHSPYGAHSHSHETVSSDDDGPSEDAEVNGVEAHRQRRRKKKKRSEE